MKFIGYPLVALPSQEGQDIENINEIRKKSSPRILKHKADFPNIKLPELPSLFHRQRNFHDRKPDAASRHELAGLPLN